MDDTENGFDPRRDGARAAWRLTLWMIAVLGAALLIAALMARPTAANHCTGIEALQQVFEEAYGERLTFTGRANNGIRIVLFASPSGTWSLVDLDAEGTACVVASGTGGERREPAPRAAEKPA